MRCKIFYINDHNVIFCIGLREKLRNVKFLDKKHYFVVFIQAYNFSSVATLCIITEFDVIFTVFIFKQIIGIKI